MEVIEPAQPMGLARAGAHRQGRRAVRRSAVGARFVKSVQQGKSDVVVSEEVDPLGVAGEAKDLIIKFSATARGRPLIGSGIGGLKCTIRQDKTTPARNRSAGRDRGS